MKVFYFVVLLTLTSLLGFYSPAYSQSILNPADPVVTYSASAPPTQPAYGTIGKWVRTKRLNWNTDSFRCYFYKGRAFRLRFPKTYKAGVVDGKIYPMMIFFHGAGEGSSSIYDNEYQLYHGGQFFSQSVDNGKWDGYELAMQTTASWGPAEYAYIKEIIDYMVTNNKLDPFHVVDNGLSAGGQGTWEMYTTYPTYIAGLVPMSAVYSAYTDPAFVNKVKFTPIWNMHGGLDGAPAPYTAAQVLTAMQNGGANYTDKLYVTLGHATWDSTWLEPNFWPFMNAAYMSNPWTLFGRTQFCPGDPINVTVGLVAGLNGYQWRKDGVVIPGATTNTINVTAIGTYDARVLRGSTWSDWSHTPVVIAIKAPTVTPNIAVSGLMSKVIPAPDGNNAVNLKVPTGYISYTWEKVGSSTVIGTDSILSAGSPGNYIVQVTEKFGCSSSFSNPFTVISSAGLNKPDAASGLTVTALSQTSFLLNWNQNPNPANNETNFEVYQGTKAGGPYKLVDITAADIAKDTIKGLIPNTKYYYIVRAVNNTAASAVTSEASATTIADTQPPTTPSNLQLKGSTPSSISIGWGASTDNVGVVEYDIFVNGVKSYTASSTQTTYTINALQHKQSYSIVVKAIDGAGNASVASNALSAEPLASGLQYTYFDGLPTTITALPNFTTIAPAAMGYSTTPVVTPATDPNYFAFLWQGYITIPTSGNYSFRTTSDDGSRLWLGPLNGTTSPYSFSGTPVVNNDGVHGSTAVSSSLQFYQAGVYPIAIAYFRQASGSSPTVAWRTPSSGSSYVTIPASAYVEAAVANGAAPVIPSNLIASAQAYNKIGLTWTDNSDNESGFEIWRSTSVSSGYAIVGTTGTGGSSFIDSTVAANTRYYYQVRAINLYGQSGFTSNYAEAVWKFENNYTDSTGNGKTLTAVGSPVFDNSTKQQGVYSLKLNGTNASATIPNTSSFLQEAYAQRTISLWIRTSTTNVTNKVIFDIGGSDDGLALLLNSNKLIAAVASNNVRSNISADYTSTGWNHVAVVYNGDSLLMYINGSLEASTTSLSFHATTTTTNGARIGSTNGSNAFNNNGGFFTGWVDDFGIYNTALGADAIQTLYNFTFQPSNATTPAAPGTPAAPTNLVATGTSPATVGLTWNDNATNESGYQVYRSNNDNLNYVLLTTLPAGSVSYQDKGLFANAIYYYKVSAINVSGSAGSNADSALTLDNPPVISQLSSQAVRYSTTTNLNITATDADAGTLSFSASNLPSFGHLTDNGNGTAVLTLSPAVSDQGVYSGLKVIVKDVQGGADTTTFSLTVNDNYVPVMDTITSYTIDEADSLSLNLHASDQNAGDTLSWSASNLPAGYTLANVSNGVATLVIRPGYAAAGTYTVQVTVSDGKGGVTTRSFGLVVNDKTPPTTTIYMRFKNSATAPAPWNNITGQSTSNLLSDAGTATPVGLQIQGSWYSTFNSGISTGNNSGVYPDVVLNEYFFFGSYPGTFSGPNSVTSTITGLDTTHRYMLSFYAGSAWGVQANNGVTVFTVGSQSIPIAVQNNTQTLATFSNLRAGSDGTLNFTAATDPNTLVGYLNAIVLTSVFDDGTSPAAPTALTASDAPGQGAQLSWTNVAYNASGNQVLRTTDTTTAFSVVGQASATAVSYTDTTAAGNTHYYYKVQAVNANGSSPYSNIAGVVTSDKAPRLTAIGNLILHNDQQTTVAVTATDDPGDHVTLTATNLPSFASFTDNGDGTGTISLVPNGAIGSFNGVTVTATDNSDSSRSTSFNISVVDKNVSSTYVMFSGGPLGPQPWNSFVNAPFAGATLTNLVDDGGNNTGATVTLVDGFQWFISTGMRPGNGMTIYPEPVIRNGFYESSTATHTMTVTGLDVSKRYNFVFFNSHDDGFKCLTNFTINGQTVSLNATYNIDKTVQLNGITPDASGKVTITVAKAAGQDYAFLTTMVIQRYDSVTAGLLSPSDLRVLGTTRATVSLQWADRSTGETAIEVWRSNSSTGTYSLVKSLPAGTTNYKDSGLTANTTYYYTVRAVNSTTSSDYSGAVTATTLVNQVYINYANGNQSPIPWNNTNTNPQQGWIWNNLYDELGVPTNTGMTITRNFDGLYSAGVQTGDNSGVYPDKVMFDSYGLFPGDSAALKITGLNLSQVYNFTFFGSTTVWGDVNTSYTINGRSALLNTSVNSTGTVTLYGVVPDANGEVTIGVAPGTSTSQFGLLGSLVVGGYNAPTSSSAPSVPVVTHATSVIGTVATASRVTVDPVASDPDSLLAIKNLNAYPNPFNQSFTLVAPAVGGDNVQVLIYDMNGRLVYGNKFSNLNEGNNYMTIVANGNFARTGIYIVRVIYLDHPKMKSKTFKLIKQ